MGIGTALVRRCLALVTESLPEVVEAYLHVQSNNEEVIEFYIDKFGFEKGELLRHYYRRIEPPDAYVLRKRLSGT